MLARDRTGSRNLLTIQLWREGVGDGDSDVEFLAG